MKAAYFSNTTLSGSVALARTDSTIDFNWGSNGPGSPLPADKFSIRWTGQIEAPATGTYTFFTRSDDGVRLWVDGKVLINNWNDHSAAWDQTVPVTLTAGKKYDIQAEYYENLGSSVIQLFWSYPNQAEQVIPSKWLYPSTITVQPAPAAVSRVWVSDLNWLSESNGWGPAERDRSNGEIGAHDGKPISVGGHKYAHGIGAHAASDIRIALDDRYDMFRAVVGVDNEVTQGSVVFEVWLDGRRAYQSPVMRGNTPGLAIAVPVEDAREMRLVVTDAGDGIGYDHADWADARFEGIETVKYLSDMNWTSATNGMGPVERDRANGSSATADGKRIQLRGTTYRKGLGTAAVSQIVYALDKKYDLFSAVVGIDDSANGAGSVVFEVWADALRVYQSPVLNGKSAVQHIDVSVTDRTTLTLKVLDGGDGTANDLADWADAKLLPVGSDSVPSTAPPAPTGLAATAAPGQVTLTWKASTGASSYNVYRGTGAGAEAATPVATGLTALSWINTGLTNGTTYFFQVRAVGTGGTSNPSNEASAKPEVAPPSTAPGTLTAAAGDAQVTLEWTASTGATSYNVYRGTSSGNESNTPVVTGITALKWVNTGLTNGTTYYYKVKGVNAGGTSGFSNEASAKPQVPSPTGAPANVTAVAGNAQVTLNWTALAGAPGYRIFRGTASNAQAANPVGSTTDVKYVDKSLTNGTQYFYKVAAYTAGGNGPMSAEVRATPIAPPAVPTGITVSSANQQITLTWPTVTNAATYNVYRGLKAGAEDTTPIASALTTPTFTNTGLTNGTTYYYKMTAVNGSGESSRSSEVNGTPISPPAGVDPATVSAWRLLRQATWGPKPGDVEHVKQVGVNGFLNEQFAATASTYPDALYKLSVESAQEQFMQNGLTGSDQLRQRMAWALHKIWVVSAVEVSSSDAIVNYHRIFMNNAFGNFRTLMTEVTLNPAMGQYLNMLNNKSKDVTGVDPNENYAREVMQLFTIGIPTLNQDGSAQTNNLGAQIPAYTETDVKELARIFTGWTFGDGNAATVPTRAASTNWRVPMEAVERYHDTKAKTFLGVNFAPGQTARQDLDKALDTLFNHPNVPPFICRQLIQQLVTSNPSKQYISDVAAVFINNGSNVRGDLAAVVRKILTHPEAQTAPASGYKLMEPALFVLSQLRSLNASVVDHPFMSDKSEEMGQKVFYPGSVFSYFSPGYHIRNTALTGPEFQILTSVTALVRTNFVAQLISNQFGSDVTIDYTPFTSRASDAGALVDYCSLLFMGGQMSLQQRNEIVNAVQVSPVTSTTERVRTAIYLTLASGQYQVDR